MMKIKKILEYIRKNKTFLISTHVSPDPDALCSELAFALFLKSKRKTVHIVNADKVPQRYHFISGTRSIKKVNSRKKIKYDVAVVLDCGDLDRIGPVQKMLDPAKPIVNIDHHITNDCFGSANLVVPEASSTAEILFDVFKKARCKMTKMIATNLYLGIMTDTGSFRYENTTAKTHSIVSELMKFQITPPALYQNLYETIPINDQRLFTKIVNRFEPLFNGKVISVSLPKKIVSQFTENVDLRDKLFRFLRATKGVEVLVIFTEYKRNLTRVNLRSQNKFNVARLANHFGGGGHKRASGCMLNYTLAETKRKVLKRIKKLL